MTHTRKEWLITTLVALLVLGAIGFFWAARNRSKTAAENPSTEPLVAEPASITVPEAGAHFAKTDIYDKLAAENARIDPALPSFKVEPSLANVANHKDYGKLLEPALMKMIEKNGFAVTPTDYIQMFYLYENNEYQRPQKFPAFITADSMLHTYHVFYDYTLRQVETYKLFDAAVRLTHGMLDASEEDYSRAKDPNVKAAARRNVIYFAVARKLLTGEAPPSYVKSDADADLANIERHGGKGLANAIGVSIDFTQFVPRGHYTRTEKLKKYFKAMMWYGLSPMPIPTGKAPELTSQTRQALLITRNLTSVQSDGKSLFKLWDMIYEPTCFYVGSADDHTCYEYSRLMSKLYGDKVTADSFADDAKLTALISEVKKLPPAGIDSSVSPDGYSSVHQFRFMGQRFIPDSRVFNELVSEERAFPQALDAFAAMGSERALQIVKTTEHNKFSPQYDRDMAAMRAELKATPKSRWMSNLYWGWLWTLQATVEPAPKGYPSFTQTQSWTDRCLLAGLGSWTELRHDTILYAKESSAECGGDSEEPPATPKGYVEPNLEFWTRMKWLNEYTRVGLNSRGLLTEELKDRFEKLDDWITFCRDITIKELTGKPVTEREYETISMYGASLDELTTSIAGGDLLTDTDRDMAVVADVHTAFGSGLEEGTGRASAIYVVVPIDGELYLTRGAVYSHYEFTWPSDDRLTDEKWQKMLNSGKAPAFADWVKSFFVNTKNKPDDRYGLETTGC